MRLRGMVLVLALLGASPAFGCGELSVNPGAVERGRAWLSAKLEAYGVASMLSYSRFFSWLPCSTRADVMAAVHDPETARHVLAMMDEQRVTEADVHPSVRYLVAEVRAAAVSDAVSP